MKTKRIPFDIEKAKNGAKVITRDGCSVKRLFYDIEHKSNDYPILAYVREDEEERTLSFTELGQHVKCCKSKYDLFIEEEVENDSNNQDETIRKALISYFQYFPYNSLVDSGLNTKDVIAWLEKQGEQETLCDKCKKSQHFYSCQDITALGRCAVEHEQKTTDKFEIKPDKWYVCIEMCHSIDVIDFAEGHYYLGSDILKYGLLEKSKDYIDYFHPWNIQDAKEGDVLYSGEVIFIFNRIKGEWIHCCCTLHRDGSFISENYDLMHIKHCKEVQPATKEQYDLLFQKMKEAGYEWDSDKKELKKIGESKTRLMTHQELADWLRNAPEEHREYRYAGDKNVYNTYDYPEIEAKTPVDENIITIRRNHGEWNKPLIEE